MNKITGRWDYEKLGAVFQDLGYRALETGFSQTEIDEVQAKLESMVDQGMIDGELAAIEKIPQYHKIAVRDAKKGEYVIKYGEKIGVATKDIKTGQHVHVQNVASESQQ